jgi:hypothetical protein
MPYITIRYERQKLYDEVWAEPVRTVAKRYGVSDVALRKTCQKLAVPLPGRGHWARVEAGRIPPRRVLPKFSGATVIVRNRRVPDESQKLAQPEPEHLVARRAFEARPENKVIVGETLDNLHPLVAATEKALRRRKSRDKWGYPLPYSRATLDLAVSDDALPRSLRIMDALAKALASRGMPLRADREGRKRTFVSVLGEDIPIRVFEKSTRAERPLTVTEKRSLREDVRAYIPNRYTYHPAGMLTMSVVGDYGPRCTVSDGKRARLEDKLNDFIVSLEAEAVQRKRDRERQEQEQREWRAQEQQRIEREIRRSEERQRLEELEQQARQWRRAEKIRAYVLAAESTAIREHETIDPDSELGQWLAWARQQANIIDPLVEYPSSESENQVTKTVAAQDTPDRQLA